MDDRFIAESDYESIESKWDAEAERLMDGYTSTWTDQQRASFRERIWPKPLPVIPVELTLTD